MPGQHTAWHDRNHWDSDIITEMRPEHIQRFISSLQNELFIDEEMIADAIQRNSSFNILHRETMFKVDVFIPSTSQFQKSQLARAQTQAFELEQEMSAKFASAEDKCLKQFNLFCQ